MIVDDALGRVVATLDSLGLAENTLVIYVADHGDLIASRGGLMNKDALMVEETMRVPMVLRWPNGFAGGRVSRALVSNMDLARTVLDAVQADAPAPLDSDSLIPLCRTPDAPGREALMCEEHGEARIEFFQRMIRWKTYKYIAHLDDEDELYDLAQDPCELRNTVHEPEYTMVLNHMRSLLTELMEEHEDRAPDAERLRSRLSSPRHG